MLKRSIFTRNMLPRRVCSSLIFCCAVNGTLVFLPRERRVGSMSTYASLLRAFAARYALLPICRAIAQCGRRGANMPYASGAYGTRKDRVHRW